MLEAIESRHTIDRESFSRGFKLLAKLVEKGDFVTISSDGCGTWDTTITRSYGKSQMRLSHAGTCNAFSFVIDYASVRSLAKMHVVSMTVCDKLLTAHTSDLSSLGVLLCEEQSRNAFPNNHVALLERSSFMRAFEVVKSAVCEDGIREHLTRVHVDLSYEGTTVCATDGHRLHTATAKALSITEESSVYVSAEWIDTVATVLKSRDEAVTLFRDGNSYGLRGSSWDLSFPRNDTSFPPWRQVIPADHTHRVVLSEETATAFRAWLKSLPRGRNATTVKLELSHGDMVLSQEGIETKSHTTLRVDSPVRFKIGFSGRYMLDALNASSGEISLKFGETNLDPIVVQAEGTKHVMMPIRI